MWSRRERSARRLLAQRPQVRHEDVLETRRVDPGAHNAKPGGRQGGAETVLRSVGVRGEDVQAVTEALDVDDRLVGARDRRQHALGLGQIVRADLDAPGAKGLA